MPVAGIGNVTAVAAGFELSLALRSDGTVWSWGWNYYGQLGDGLTSSVITGNETPAPVRNLNGVSAIAAGGLLEEVHGVALKMDGTVWAWGSNTSGQLGDASNINRLEPVSVTGLSGVTAIAAGERHTLALKNDGTVWAWGSNLLGQLGDGTTTSRSRPVQVLLPVKIVKISAGANYNVALATDGALWAWGDNSQGQLGTVAGALSATPVAVGLTTQVIGIAAGVDQTVVELADGSVLAWGGNEYGQLGDGTFAQHRSPVLVVNSNVDGFLNLVTGTTLNVPPELNVPFFVSASGAVTDTSATVSTTTKFNIAHIGQPGAVFVTAMVPTGSLGATSQAMSASNASRAKALAAPATSSFALMQLTASGWQPVVNGQLIPYATGVLGDQLAAQTILNGTDTTNLLGAEFCVGYGTSADEMTYAGRMRAVATIPDPSGTNTNAGSCIITVPISDARVFAYAEANYSNIFTAPATSGQYLQYDYRYYPASQNYLAVDTNGEIFILGPISGNVITSVGPVESFRSYITGWEAER